MSTALRHLGRAMAALQRANVPPAGDFVTGLYRLNVGVDLVGKASAALIDGIEAIAPDVELERQP